jgi:hypothetical protein
MNASVKDMFWILFFYFYIHYENLLRVRNRLEAGCLNNRTVQILINFCGTYANVGCCGLITVHKVIKISS